MFLSKQQWKDCGVMLHTFAILLYVSVFQTSCPALQRTHQRNSRMWTSELQIADNKSRQLNSMWLPKWPPAAKWLPFKLCEEWSRFRTAVNLLPTPKPSHLESILCSFRSHQPLLPPVLLYFFPLPSSVPLPDWSPFCLPVTPTPPPHTHFFPFSLRHDLLKQMQGFSLTALSLMLSTDSGIVPRDLWHLSGTWLYNREERL